MTTAGTFWPCQGRITWVTVVQRGLPWYELHKVWVTDFRHSLGIHIKKEYLASCYNHPEKKSGKIQCKKRCWSRTYQVGFTWPLFCGYKDLMLTWIFFSLLEWFTHTRQQRLSFCNRVLYPERSQDMQTEIHVSSCTNEIVPFQSWTYPVLLAFSLNFQIKDEAKKKKKELFQ